MGQDISVLVMPGLVSHDAILGVLRSAVAPSMAEHLVAAFGRGAHPPLLEQPLPPHTALTLWADAEFSLDPIAAALSRALGVDCLIVTAADHSCVGGWALFKNGSLHSQRWAIGDGYLALGEEGLHQLAGASPSQPSWAFDPSSFVGALAEPAAGYCLRSNSAAIRVGESLSAATLVGVTEDSVPGVTFECVLAVPS